MHSHITLTAALSLAAVASLAGCVTQDSRDLQAGLGAISLPLIQTGPDGAEYQLTNAVLEIEAQGFSAIVDASNFDSSLNLELPVGLASIRLLDGWTLMRTPATGSIPEPVDALLGTENPLNLRVLANHTASLSFGFIVRSPFGEVDLTFGVVTEPRQLAGGVRVLNATGAFESYRNSSTTRLADFAFYYELHHMDSVILPDGTKERVYYAGFDSYEPSPIAAEFFNDAVGPLSQLVAPDLAGGYLEYHIGAKPDGSIELYGTFGGWSTVIDFGPVTLLHGPSLDADGFPADAFFHEAFVPFTLVYTDLNGDSMMDGTLNLRHIP